jgi:hypothetical protein
VAASRQPAGPRRKKGGSASGRPMAKPQRSTVKRPPGENMRAQQRQVLSELARRKGLERELERLPQKLSANEELVAAFETSVAPGGRGGRGVLAITARRLVWLYTMRTSGQTVKRPTVPRGAQTVPPRPDFRKMMENYDPEAIKRFKMESAFNTALDFLAANERGDEPEKTGGLRTYSGQFTYEEITSVRTEREYLVIEASPKRVKFDLRGYNVRAVARVIRKRVRNGR